LSLQTNTALHRLEY